MTTATKLKPIARQKQVLALIAAGLTQKQIAAELGVSRASIARDCAELQPDTEQVEQRLQRLNQSIDQFVSVEQRARKYAELATKAKNEAVSLGALQRIDDLEGIVTDKERLRAKQSEQPANQAMFILAPGMNISFGPSTTGSGSLPSNGAIEVKPNVINTDDNA